MGGRVFVGAEGGGWGAERTTAALSRNWKLISKSKTNNNNNNKTHNTKTLAHHSRSGEKNTPVFLFAPSTALGKIQMAVLSSYLANRVGVGVGCLLFCRLSHHSKITAYKIRNSDSPLRVVNDQALPTNTQKQPKLKQACG